MFRSARIKLTLWYTLIIVLISVGFSISIYFHQNREFNANLRRISLRYEAQRRIFGENTPLPPSNQDVLEAARNRLLLYLAYVNAIILILSASSGYFLAGKTLQPIAEMVDEENRFITDASHELRTPITALKTAIEVNLRDKNLSLAEAKNLLKSNLNDVNNLQVLSENLLILSRQNSKKDYFEKVSISEVIKNSIDKEAVWAKSKNIKIKNDAKNIIMEGNREELTRVLVIFLDNAIKYGKKGGSVIIDAKKTDHKAKITIEDNGTGIDEKDMPHIFDRFYRGESKFSSDGYGLGLSIAKKIVMAHHGLIEVESKKNKGTTFTIYLPMRSV